MNPRTARATRLVRTFLDDFFAGMVVAAVIAVLGYLAFAATGCVAGIGTTAEPLVVDDDADTEVWGGLGDTAWPGADAGGGDTAVELDAWSVLDTGAGDAGALETPDTAPASDTAPAPDTHPPPDTAPSPDLGTDTAASCPSRVYCTFATGAQGRVGAACFYSDECCSGYCFDPVPGDGIKGSCYADTGAPGWCGGTGSAPEWCPGTPDKVCKGGS